MSPARNDGPSPAGDCTAQPMDEPVGVMDESIALQVAVALARADGNYHGRVDVARRAVLRLGRKRFGPPDPATLAQVESLTDLDRLEELIDRLSGPWCWQELLR